MQFFLIYILTNLLNILNNVLVIRITEYVWAELYVKDKLVNHLQMAVILFLLIKGFYVYIWQSCKIL